MSGTNSYRERPQHLVDALEKLREKRVAKQVAAMRAVGRTWKGPKSFCTCGHAGDGEGVDVDKHVSTHGSLEGHGPCFVSGCECCKFTWSAHTYTYEAALQKAKTEA